MSLTTYYAYIYADPDSYEPFYVGKGKQYRAYAHMQFNRKCVNKRFRNRLLKLVEQSKKPIITLMPTSSEELALMLEKGLIKLFGRKDLNKGSLYNYTDGGEGSSNTVRSEEAKRKTSESLKKFYQTHKIVKTKESIDKMKAAKKANPTGTGKWMHKDGIQIKVKTENIDIMIADGWKLGITKKHITEEYKEKLKIRAIEQWTKLKNAGHTSNLIAYKD